MHGTMNLKKQLICSAFGVQRTNDGHAMCIALTTVHGTISARCRSLQQQDLTWYTVALNITTTLGFAISTILFECVPLCVNRQSDGRFRVKFSAKQDTGTTHQQDTGLLKEYALQ
jgi:hypothetical protein